MNKHVNLHKAKKAKNDEFYTRLEDIELELSNYPVGHFKDKVIYCPCDVGVEDLDIPKSNFIKYFEDNKDRLGYKKLIHTSLQEGFDYRSDYCQKLFKEADVVVTNPPFSLFREFMTILTEHNKKFIIIGNQNAITYKEIFPLIKENKMWLGVPFKGLAGHFYSPYEDTAKSSNHKGGMIRVSGTCWFTNVDLSIRHEPMILYKQYNEQEYPKYDNYDAIEISKTKNIPFDYDGVMGVPITFLYKYNPEQFEIVGISSEANNQNVPKLHDKVYYKGYVRGVTTLVNVDSSMPILRTPDFGGTECSNGIDSVYQLYWRIFIKRKKKQ